ncbi:MAG: hypothetical protein EOP83_12775 [Verrucomicrobiaceae bacterium]|nr:MAG: hypothetical protein EOP83_12775 [Verrucomicrobiaceae bacterium]
MRASTAGIGESFLSFVFRWLAVDGADPADQAVGGPSHWARDCDPEQDKEYLAKLKVRHSRAEKASEMEAKTLLNTEIAKLEAFTGVSAGRQTQGAQLPELAYKWEAVSKDEFRIYHQDGFYWLFEFSREAGFAKSTKKRGAAQDESKTIRLLYKMGP